MPGAQLQLQGEEGTGGEGVEGEMGRAFAVNLHLVETLIHPFIGEVHPLEAAGIHRRDALPAYGLGAVIVAQGDIAEGGTGQVGHGQGGVRAQDELPLGAQLGLHNRNVCGQYGGSRLP